jgi:KDO2-lipid IV(A) lauroyltransferase
MRGAGLMGRLGVRGLSVLSWCLAWVWWWILPTRRDLARENMERALPGLKTPPILRKMMADLILSMLELLAPGRRRSAGLVFEGLEPIRERVRSGKGTLLLAGHSGAWEAMAAAVSRDEQIPLTLIGRKIAWGPARRAVGRLRSKAGIEVLPPEGSVFRTLAALQEGRVVVFLLDQRHNSGIPVSFFGRQAWTSRALALVAARSGCPVHGVWSWRAGLAQHKVTFGEMFPLCGNIGEDTQLFMDFYEAHIREHPESWLWLHDRWRQPEMHVA